MLSKVVRPGNRLVIWNVRATPSRAICCAGRAVQSAPLKVIHPPEASADERDGLRLAWRNRWVHLRPSGTEPVVRFIAEAPTPAEAQELVEVCRTLLQS